MACRLVRPLAARAAGLGGRRGVAVLTLAAIVLALAPSLFTPRLDRGTPYCCRSGGCCCDSSRGSPSGLDLRAACRCARPDGAALAAALPAGVLGPGATLADPAPAEPLVRAAVPRLREGERPPPDQPPRLSRAT